MAPRRSRTPLSPSKNAPPSLSDTDNLDTSGKSR